MANQQTKAEYRFFNDMTREQWSRLKAMQAQYRRACVLRDKAKTLWHRAKGVNPKSPSRAALMARVDVLGQQAAALWPADQPHPTPEDGHAVDR